MKDFCASDRKAPGLAPRMLIVYRAVDTILRRWETLTGASARHAVSGRSFEDFAREAEAANAR
jgi:hypothetical protein